MKYIIKFKKTGVICYTSHLDIIKVFKRAFKRADIRLAYSQGFNPHPKMGFAQPLSLGYKGYDEYLEFETAGEDGPEYGNEILKKLKAILPEGITLASISAEPELKKTLASQVVAADYEIRIPLKNPTEFTSHQLWLCYMGQEKIMALKKQKKKPEPVLIDIKPKIHEIRFLAEENLVTISCRLDAGSESNLSPELLIDSFADITGIEFERSEIEIIRSKLHFKE